MSDNMIDAVADVIATAHGLTAVEHRTLRAMLYGHANQEIADGCVSGIHTALSAVKKHTANIYQKVGIGGARGLLPLVIHTAAAVALGRARVEDDDL